MGAGGAPLSDALAGEHLLARRGRGLAAQAARGSGDSVRVEVRRTEYIAMV